MTVLNTAVTLQHSQTKTSKTTANALPTDNTIMKNDYNNQYY